MNKLILKTKNKTPWLSVTHILFCVFIYTLPSFSFAFFCPTNFNQISTGATIEQVTQICGKPDKQETSVKKAEVAQEWSYFIPQTVTTPSLSTTQGTLKADITFDSSGKAINISVNGIGVGATTICGGFNLQLGADREQVRKACGEPKFINKNANPALLPAGTQPETKVTTFIYNTTPPVKLIFENGILTEQQ